MLDLDRPLSPNHLLLSRRRELRIDVTGPVTASPALPGAPEVLAVHDLSFRGCAIDSTHTVAPRTRVSFRFDAPGALPFVAVAVAIHSHRLPGRPELWRTGWEFPEQAGLEMKIQDLLNAAVGELVVE